MLTKLKRYFFPDLCWLTKLVFFFSRKFTPHIISNRKWHLAALSTEHKTKSSRWKWLPLALVRAIDPVTPVEAAHKWPALMTRQKSWPKERKNNIARTIKTTWVLCIQAFPAHYSVLRLCAFSLSISIIVRFPGVQKVSDWRLLVLPYSQKKRVGLKPVIKEHRPCN